MTISAQHTAETEPWKQIPLEQVILRLPVGPAELPLATDEQPAPDLEELGSYGSCHICWGAGIVEDFDGDRDCYACNGTGDITQGDHSQRSTS